MGNESRRRRKRRAQQAETRPNPREPWLSIRTGLRVVTLASLILAIFVGWQVYPAGGMGQALLIGGGFGASIWVVFYLTFRLNSWLKKR